MPDLTFRQGRGMHGKCMKMISQFITLANHIHALSMHTYTLSEWQVRHGDAPLSPPCLGGERSGGEGQVGDAKVV